MASHANLNHYTLGQSNSIEVDLTLSEYTKLRALVKDNLRRAQQRMADLANTHRLDKQFEVSDLVYLRLHELKSQ